MTGAARPAIHRGERRGVCFYVGSTFPVVTNIKYEGAVHFIIE